MSRLANGVQLREWTPKSGSDGATTNCGTTLFPWMAICILLGVRVCLAAHRLELKSAASLSAPGGRQNDLWKRLKTCEVALELYIRVRQRCLTLRLARWTDAGYSYELGRKLGMEFLGGHGDQYITILPHRSEQSSP